MGIRIGFTLRSYIPPTIWGRKSTELLDIGTG
jgi:hypothetical protein